MSSNIVFVKNEDFIAIRQTFSENVIDHLPAAVYTPVYDSQTGAVGVVKRHESFHQKDTIRYGVITEYRDRIVKQYKENMAKGPLGVLAVGRVGSGKSLMGEDIANRLIQQGIPTLLVDKNIPIPILYKIVDSITSAGTPLFIYMDEFGKLYNTKDNDGETNRECGMFLKMFSDASLKGALFYLSTNAHDSFMRAGIFDRPTRFMFRVPVDFMEVCAYLDMIEQSKANESVKDALLLTMMEAHLDRIAERFSTDVLRFILDNIVTPDMTYSELREAVLLYNVPTLFYHTFTIKTDDEHFNGNYYKFLDFKNRILRVEILETHEILKFKIDLKKLIRESVLSATTSEMASEGNIAIADAAGNTHTFDLRIASVRNESSHFKMIPNFKMKPREDDHQRVKAA